MVKWMEAEKSKHKNSNYIYKKLFQIYTLVIVAIVLILELYFVTSIQNQRKETNLHYTQMMCEEAIEYIGEMSDDIDHILYKMYDMESSVLEDVIWYLEYPLNTYLVKKLDAYSESSKSVYVDISDFVVDAADQNEHIREISFISYRQELRTDYTRAGNAKITSFPEWKWDHLKEGQMVIDKTFFLKKEIRNPVTLEGIGCLIISYDNIGLRDAYRYYDNAQLAVLDEYGSILYSSEEISADMFFDSEGTLYSNSQMEDSLNSYVQVHRMSGILTVGYIDKGQAKQIPFVICITLTAVGFLLFSIGECYIYTKLKHLERRMEMILNAMDKVTEGDLSVRIALKNEADELNVIGENFNQMCLDLNAYIQKSYLAEIEQKNAEMNALQNQINPHFLYNTLESIRMKAISNGDKEVGKMLYGLAVIFRSQLKDNNIIMLAKELHYCKKYLELFEFRYQNKFRFQIICKEEWLEYPIIKFSLQPFIENYFVHGIRLEDSDNTLNIIVEKDRQDMYILIEDNGRGMGEEELDEKNEMLKTGVESGKSIGLMNVQKRFHAVYGEDYGLQLRKNTGNGITVVIKFPKGELAECTES